MTKLITIYHGSEKNIEYPVWGEGRKNNQSNILRNGPSVSAYQKIDAVVDIKVVLELLGISLGLVFVSSLASMISIQRFSPLTILKERS